MALLHRLNNFLAGRTRAAATPPTDLSVIEAKLEAIARDVQKISRDVQTIEAFSHGARAVYIGNGRILVRIVVDNANIALIVEAEDKLLSPWFIATGGYETDLTNFFLKNLKKDSHSLDIGANFGYFTCLFSRFSPEGRIIAVEADECIFELVRDNIAINGFESHAVARHAAACCTNDFLTLYRRTGRSANTSIASVPDTFTAGMGEPPVVPFSVQGIRIDDLLGEMKGRVDFIKIDIEGAEPLAFRGAIQTIDANPQIQIVMEWSPNQISHAGFDVGEFIRQMAGMKLEVHDISPSGDVGVLSFDQLATLPYRAGIVLRHQQFQKC